MLGYHSDKDFLAMVCAKMIPNCAFTIDDFKLATKIFGKNLPDVIGKTIRKKPERVIPEYTDIPDDVIEENRLVTLMRDVMFVNQIPFLIRSARQISLQGPLST